MELNLDKINIQTVLELQLPSRALHSLGAKDLSSLDAVQLKEPFLPKLCCLFSSLYFKNERFKIETTTNPMLRTVFCNSLIPPSSLLILIGMLP